ncbi:MAG: hypothetical protein H6828_11810 [Planctomycetes bacterium]|nr:hypothetical protein [Planctomycetota bacterium]
MKHVSRLARLRLSLLGLGALLLASCQELPKVPGKYVSTLYVGGLESTQPADVVVAPVADESLTQRAPKAALREAFQSGLVKRRYSPLALDYVDRRVVEAAYAPGSLQEDAVLQVTVRQWDMSRWDSHGEVAVEVEAWMLGADGVELWGGKLTRKLDLSTERQHFPTTREAFERGSVLIAEELLEVMPARNPRR